MAARGTAAFLSASGTACQMTWSRQASRITKFKKPFVGGIWKKTQLPLRPRDEEEYAAEGESLYPEIPGEYPPGKRRRHRLRELPCLRGIRDIVIVLWSKMEKNRQNSYLIMNNSLSHE